MARRLTSKKLRGVLYRAAGGNCCLCGVELPDQWHAENRMDVLRKIVDSLEQYEAAVVRDWIMERLH